MAAMAPVISPTWATMRSSDWPVSPTNFTPSPTCWLLAVISALISLAAAAERWARARTSLATTAKPRPASPARAASTPAFRASRLVWNAISSITPMIWPIWLDEVSIAAIAVTACFTIAPECSASMRAWRTTSLACPAPPAVRVTVAVISSNAAAVCSRLAACCSVRRDRSSAAWVISPVPERMALVLAITVAMVSFNWPTAALKSVRSRSYSGAKRCSIMQVRSPEASRARLAPSPSTTTACCAAASARSASVRVRSAAAALRIVSASASSRSFSMAASLNTCTAWLISPISSRRARNGTSTDRSPADSAPVLRANWARVRPMERQSSRPRPPASSKQGSATKVKMPA